MLLLLVACRDRPQPFGTMRGKLTALAADCPRPLTTETVTVPTDRVRQAERERAIAFEPGTRRHVCAAPTLRDGDGAAGGWAVYVDSSERIVGICVADRVVPNYVANTKLARPLLAKLVSTQFAADVTEGRCSFLPERVPHGLLRWEDYKRPEPEDGGPATPDTVTNTDARCCWKVIDS